MSFNLNMNMILMPYMFQTNLILLPDANTTKFAKVYKNILRIITVCLVPVIACLPSVCCTYIL